MNLRNFSIAVLGFFALTAVCQELQAQVVQPGTQTNGSETNNIITAVPFLLITPDARAGAMGEAAPIWYHNMTLASKINVCFVS